MNQSSKSVENSGYQSRAEMRDEMRNRDMDKNETNRKVIDGKAADKNPVEEKDIENVLKILEEFSESETSRLKIQVSEEETPGKAERVYHYGRCDVGSPWARGECYDLPEQD
ncbi:hypothetical protein D3Z45_14925 [Lachnospiraceae bacterium]|nr:hypothetical protein [Lachnospiraceae bacterium]